MVILALYAAIVLRWCKQIDFVIPFNVSGRSCPEQLEAMGLFVHPLLLRMELNGSETLQELLGLVSQEFLAAHEHLDCGRAIAEAPDLLNGSFLNWVPWEPAELAGIPSAFGGHHSNSCLAVESFDISGELTAITRITKKIDCDIGMTISNTNQGIRWSINYRADLFTVDTMHRLARDLQLMAEQMVGDPRVCAASFHAGVETRNC